MVVRIILLCLCLSLLSTVNGCVVEPYPLAYGTLAPSWGTGPHETYRGTDYEQEIDQAVEQYRRRRSAQEREQEWAHQQWEQERARERDPRWER